MGFKEWMNEASDKEKGNALGFFNDLELENLKRAELGSEELTQVGERELLESLDMPSERVDFFNRFIGIKQESRKKQMNELRAHLRLKGL